MSHMRDSPVPSAGSEIARAAPVVASNCSSTATAMVSEISRNSFVGLATRRCSPSAPGENLLWRIRCGSGREAAPVGDLFQAFSAGVLEKSDSVAGMFEFMNVGPDLRLPRALMDGGLAATGAAGVKGDVRLRTSLRVLRFERQFEEDAADFFNLFVGTEDVFVTEQVSEAQFAGFEFSFFAGVERSVFGAQLLGRV